MSEDLKKGATEGEKAAEFKKSFMEAAEFFKDFPERSEKMLESMFEASNAYLSKFITIGYASFFGIWALVRNEMTGGQALVTALFMLISVSLYVCNEIWHAIHWNALSGKWTAATGKGSAQKNVDNFQNLSKDVQAAMKAHGRMRPSIFRLILIFAALAVITMLFALITNLWALYVMDARFMKT